MRRSLTFAVLMLCGSLVVQAEELTISRADYAEKLHGFWLGQCIANWTGIITEMDKIGGEGERGKFYTRKDWGTTVQVVRWTGELGDPKTIDWVRRSPDEIWGADDDTDIEYIYQYLLANSDSTRLTGEQIRDGWLTHIYDEESAPGGENFLWVSNQRTHDLMLEGIVPPATSDPSNNEWYEMIDAQLTTEIFGLYAPGRPDIGLELAYMPIRTTAGGEAALASEFYVIMHSLAATVDPTAPRKDAVHTLASRARSYMPDESTTAKMYDFVLGRYEAGVPWEEARDDVYRRYQLEQEDGYDKWPRNPVASGINFASSIVSLLYGEGSYEDTVKIAVLAGWDSDNPAATWGGLLGFLYGKQGIEEIFGQKFSDRYHIHRTRKGFSVPDGIDTFPNMAAVGVEIVDRVVANDINGEVQGDQWVIPLIAQ
ncbi:MAG: ADP-ribosylglycohydrolase family protein [Gammaproteobacteria bacterium]|nr:ADP-ribosylglycohydrolase family protein [Gammaproteobacteria bacterium]